MKLLAHPTASFGVDAAVALRTSIGETPGRSFPGLPPATALSWLVRLRWIAVLGQLAALLVAAMALELALPLRDLLAVVAVEAASNLLLPIVAHRAATRLRAVLGAALAFDLLCLTALLALAGGPASHFSVLYLVPIALAALVLGIAWGWVAVAVSSLCYASLFLVTRPLPHVHDGDHGFGVHILGMWVATALAAVVIATVVGRIASALRAREQEVHALEARAARDQKLVSLSTLAAGAAHELGSPLATIAVAARELEHAARDGRSGDAIGADARLIREQVERCGAILAQMGEAAGSAAGEAPTRFPPEGLLADVLAALPPDARARLDLAVVPATPPLLAPRGGLVRAVTNLVRNALDASSPQGRVKVAAEGAGGRLRVVVSDAGVGMPPEVLARAGEPFFTTKPPGQGQGLGIFLARAVAEHLGGGLALASEPGAGTTATLEIPLRRAEARAS
jgi:two-component system sensor histidine kinase RegB